MIPPLAAPINPISGAVKYPWPIMKTITKSPMPKAVPKFAKDIN